MVSWIERFSLPQTLSTFPSIHLNLRHRTHYPQPVAQAATMGSPLSPGKFIVLDAALSPLPLPVLPSPLTPTRPSDRRNLLKDLLCLSLPQLAANGQKVAQKNTAVIADMLLH